jgi:hypothetical protein
MANVAENHSDVLQAAPADHNLKGITERSLRQLRKSRLRAGAFSQAFETAPCQIKLAKAIKVLVVLDRRYVTASDQCSTVAAGPLQARPILIHWQA